MLDNVRGTGHALGAVGCGALRCGGGRNCDALNCYVEKRKRRCSFRKQADTLGNTNGKLKAYYIVSLDNKLTRSVIIAYRSCFVRGMQESIYQWITRQNARRFWNAFHQLQLIFHFLFISFFAFNFSFLINLCCALHTRVNLTKVEFSIWHIIKCRSKFLKNNTFNNVRWKEQSPYLMKNI